MIRPKRPNLWRGVVRKTHGQIVRPGIRRGYTLIEVLIVISVIGLLIALSLPAIQGAREAARRAQCSSNLRQIGIALNAYHDVYRMFPSSQLLAGPGKRWTDNCMSELAFLLPYLDQRVLYDAINMNFANREAPDAPSIENRTARNTYLSSFLCPSDGEPNHRNNYRFNRGRWRVSTGQAYDGRSALASCRAMRASAMGCPARHS